MPVPPEEAAARVDQLIGMTERLTQLITGEASAIERQDHQAVAAHRQESVRLSHAYREETAQVRADPGLVSSAPAEKRRRLVEATEAFHEVLAHHRRAILAAKTVTEGLVRAIAAEVVARRSQGVGYGPGARPPAAVTNATAVAFNRRA